ncbi:MAG: DUF523 and DUF1722 domain-containing protein [Methylohalobius sp.]|nr:DUF523 and DUF1722 domain-containing protein [Methylohalobius sp.]
MSRPQVFVSACLLGQQVRYDGGHRRFPYLAVLADYLELHPVCPEVGIGLGVPRPPVHLVSREDGLHLLEVHDHRRNYSEKMRAFAVNQSQAMAHADGFIAKKDSPSCGMARVRVHDEQGQLRHKHGVGLFTSTLRVHLPHLPVEEEGRMNDPGLRENFLTRVFVHHRWRLLQAEEITPASLLEFHTRHKYLIMAHSVRAYQLLGKRLANLKGALAEIAAGYFAELMAALARPARRSNHVNVLQHLAGYVSDQLSSGDRQELSAAIEAYRRAEVPLIVPITLLRHHQNRIQNPYLASQYYLEPYPAALGLRSAI